MVDLVLEHAGEEVVALSTTSSPPRSMPRTVMRSERTTSKRKPGTERQPSSETILALHDHDLGVDHHVRAVALVEVVGEDALAHADLGSGEAEAVLHLHGLVHAVHEDLEVAGELLHLARPRCFSTGSPK